MKTKISFAVVALLPLLCLFGCSAQAQSTNDSLAKVADKALAEGKAASLNVGFARALGLTAEQPLPLQRIQIEKDGVNSMFNVLRDRTNTIILSERGQRFATYYLTDRSGTLKRAILNDSTIVVGGMTNLSLSAAAPGFQKQKKLWLQQTAR